MWKARQQAQTQTFLYRWPLFSLLQERAAPPDRRPSRPEPTLAEPVQVPTPAELTATPQARGAFAEAAMALDSRLVGTAGSINLTEYLFRRAQRKIWKVQLTC